MIKAVIDVGSNSIKMRIANVSEKSGEVHIIRDETEVVRLGRGMSETGVLSDESMKNSCLTVSKMARKAERAGAKIFIVGTMALRTAKNSDTFIKMIKKSTGHEIHVFSGEQEAKYSWLGAVDGFEAEGKNLIMFDSGGGSTEFVAGEKHIASIPVGAVNLSEKFFSEHDKPIKKIYVDKAFEHVKNLLLENNIDKFRSDSLENQIIGVGGGIVSMASVKFACENYMPSKLHGSTLTQNDVLRQIQIYSSLTLKERENVIGLPASRADVILGSACIILATLKILNCQSCIVSINGLRHGILLSDNIIT